MSTLHGCSLLRTDLTNQQSSPRNPRTSRYKRWHFRFRALCLGLQGLGSSGPVGGLGSEGPGALRRIWSRRWQQQVLGPARSLTIAKPQNAKHEPCDPKLHVQDSGQPPSAPPTLPGSFPPYPTTLSSLNLLEANKLKALNPTP